MPVCNIKLLKDWRIGRQFVTQEILFIAACDAHFAKDRHR
jgi:hypothetical protein